MERPIEDRVSDSAAEGPPFSSALDWAADRFQFDPERAGPQPGVEDLQKWLLNHDRTIVPDSLLGPQTLAVLERAYASEILQAGRASPTAAEDDGETVLKAEGLSGEAKQSDREKLDQVFGETEGPSREESEQGETVAEAVSARPVALSDSAIDDISQDSLGFTPYVNAVAEFILAEQTRPPLSLVINAQWGQGKTSFMNMLDGQLKEMCRGTSLRVATTWFNPWKYSEPEQVWAAFVANVTRCLQDNLKTTQRRRFKWGRFIQKWQRHADLAFVLRLLVLIAFFVLVIGTAATMKWAEFGAWATQGDSFLAAAYNAIGTSFSTPWGYLLVGPFAVLALIYGYVSFTKDLGLNLLEYVEKTDFRDKIGTLSQFESEMRRLADAVPDDLKVVVFIDDLDRCKGRVLGEIIEALQLADVSRSCIFVMGMDLRIVSHAIETERSELAASAGATSEMEHGSGYKFLEKIIQARLALPTHGQAEMAQLVTSAMGHDTATTTEAETPTTETKDETILDTAIGRITGAGRERRETPRDSQHLIDTAKHYGSHHFKNPRRLKRFINGFRLQAYLAAAVQPGTTRIEHLARFLVLAEKWPALLHHLVEQNKGAEILDEEQPESTNYTMAMQIRGLRDGDRKRVIELLTGRDGSDPLTAPAIRSLAAWTGFSYYPGLEK